MEAGVQPASKTEQRIQVRMKCYAQWGMLRDRLNFDGVEVDVMYDVLGAKVTGVRARGFLRLTSSAITF